MFLVLVVSVSSLRAADWKLVFEDSFDRDTIGMNWDVVRGDWRIEKGRLVVTRLEGWTSDSVLRLMRPVPGNVRLEFDFEVPVACDLYAYVNTGEQTWGGGGTILNAGEGGGYSISARFLLSTAPETKGEPKIEIGRRYQVKLEYADGVLKRWLDGKLVGETRLDIGQCPYNDTIAFNVVRNASIGNVKVYTDGTGDTRRWAGDFSATNKKATVKAEEYLKPELPDGGIQSAIDALPASGGVVLLPAGRFEIRQPIFLRTGVVLRGQGRDTILSLPKPLIFSKTTAEFPETATSVTVEDASGFRPGMVISNGDVEYTFDHDKSMRVAKVEGNTIHFNQPLGSVWPVERRVANWFPLIWAQDTSEVEVRDLTLDGQVDDPAPFKGSYGVSALAFFRVRDWRVDNVHVSGWKGDALSFQGGRNAFLTDCNIQRADNIGYHPGSLQRRLVMSRLVAEKCVSSGFYWCRYNQESVANFNRFSDNGGMIFSGLAVAGDRYNVMNYNLGKNNIGGMAFDTGANDVFVNNVLVDSINTQPADMRSLVYITGGSYDELPPRHYNIYSGPTRNMAIVDNTIVNTRKPEQPMPAFLVLPGAASLVIAGNRFYSENLQTPPVVGGDAPHSVITDNIPLSKPEWQEPEKLPEIPKPKSPMLAGAAYYDPSAPNQGFQKALDELGQKGGGTLEIPAGRYPLRETLQIPSNVTIRGEGLATVLIATDPTKPLVAAKGAKSVALRRLWLMGTGAPVQPASADAVPLASFSDCEDVLVAEVDFRECAGAGLLVENSRGIHLRMNRLWRAGDGYRISGGKDLFFAENQALESQLTGVAVNQVLGNVRLVSNIIWFSHLNGIRVDAPDAGTVRVDANVIASSGEDGVVFQNTKGARFTGNAMLNSSMAGRGKFAQVLLKDATKTEIRGNRIGDEFYDTVIAAAVKESGAAEQNTVIYNVLCPDYWPPTASLDGLVSLTGKGSAAKDNVLLPFPKPKP